MFNLNELIETQREKVHKEFSRAAELMKYIELGGRDLIYHFRHYCTEVGLDTFDNLSFANAVFNVKFNY